jgi:4-hydroxythreonine-4-phosphate dehydrogenase
MTRSELHSKKIGISLGDPSGIGPEIVAAALHAASARLRQLCVIFGDAGWAGPEVEVRAITRLGPGHAEPGRPSLAGARAQVAYLEAAVAAARCGEIAALVTAPISKAQVRRAGFSFPGHTEFLAERLGAKRHAMMFVGPRLRVALATVHLPLAEVAGQLSAPAIEDVVELVAESLARDFGVIGPRIGVLGLNPHAGEGGLFGQEELEVIQPAIAACQARGHRVVGPLIPDAAFRQAVDGQYDGLVAMYHDQGLIPVKLVDFERAVNVTLGLPIVRTSPDHGVAYDIAGVGRARHASFAAALELAERMIERRHAAG